MNKPNKKALSFIVSLIITLVIMGIARAIEPSLSLLAAILLYCGGGLSSAISTAIEHSN